MERERERDRRGRWEREERAIKRYGERGIWKEEERKREGG